MNDTIARPLWLEEIYGGKATKTTYEERFEDPKRVGAINKAPNGLSNCSAKVAIFRDGPFLPVMTGAAASILGMMEALQGQGIKVIMIKAVREFDDFSLYDSMPFPTYFLNERDFYRDGRSFIAKILEEEGINVVQFDSAEAINIQSSLIPEGIKKVFEVINVESDLMEQQGESDSKIEYIRNEEIKACRNADLLLFRSRENILRYQDETKADIKDKTCIYRGGIDMNKYSYKNDRFLFGEKVLFLGHLNYEPNIRALEDIAKYIAPYIDREISVVGDISKDLIESYKDYKNIVFKGRVDKLDTVFNNAAVGIAPLAIGSGTRLKVLDYMAAGLPVVCSNLAIEGLEKEIRDFVVVEDDFHKYPELIKNIQYSFSTEKVDAARNYIQRNRSWDAVVEDVLNAYLHLLK